MSIQELQKKLAESKMDKVCMSVVNELATFVDWYAEYKEQKEHYMNDILILMSAITELTKGIEEYD